MNKNIRQTSGYYDLNLYGDIPDDVVNEDGYGNAEYHPATREFIIGLGSAFIILDRQSILDLKDMIEFVIEKENIR